MNEQGHVCPWWLIHTFDNPLRRLMQKPEDILSGFVKEGQTVMDIGCGMGYFSLPMARMVGEQGKVIAIDLQEKMLKGLRRRAARHGLDSRIHTHRCSKDALEIDAQVDFALAFWMVHEVPDMLRLFREVRSVLKEDARFLLVEPKLHVSQVDFAETVKIAISAGLKPLAEPQARMSRARLFARA